MEYEILLILRLKKEEVKMMVEGKIKFEKKGL